MRLWFSDKSATADVGCCVSNFALESEGNEMVSGMYDYIFVFFFNNYNIDNSFPLNQIILRQTS